MRTPSFTDWESPDSGPATVRSGLEEPALETSQGSDPARTHTPRDTVFHAAKSQWHQGDLGGAFEIGPLSVIGELDPTGVNGVLEEVLGVFGRSLEPLICSLERHRARGWAVGIRFDAGKLAQSAGQVGAMQLSQACIGITTYFATDEFRIAPERLDALVDCVMTEAVRVQRKVRQLLAD